MQSSVVQHERIAVFEQTFAGDEAEATEWVGLSDRLRIGNQVIEFHIATHDWTHCQVGKLFTEVLSKLWVGDDGLNRLQSC